MYYSDWSKYAIVLFSDLWRDCQDSECRYHGLIPSLDHTQHIANRNMRSRNIQALQCIINVHNIKYKYPVEKMNQPTCLISQSRQSTMPSSHSSKLLRLIDVVAAGDTIILPVTSFLRRLDTRRDTLNLHIWFALLRLQIGLLRRSPLHALCDDCPCLCVDLFLPGAMHRISPSIAHRISSSRLTITVETFSCLCIAIHSSSSRRLPIAAIFSRQPSRQGYAYGDSRHPFLLLKQGILLPVRPVRFPLKTLIFRVPL